MGKEKGTPGKWEFQVSPHDKFDFQVFHIVEIPGETCGYVQLIATVHWEHPASREDVEANARRIASVPELEKALEETWTSVEDDLPKEKGFYEVVVAPSRDHLRFPEEHSRIMVSKFYPDKDEAVNFYLNVRYLSAARQLGEKAQHWAISHEEGYVVTHWRRCPPMPDEPKEVRRE